MLIALVDDDNTTNFINKTIINSQFPKVKVEVFSNGKEFIDFLNQTSKIPDIAFLDLNMPVMNGIDFLRAHKNIDKAKQVSKIVLLNEKILSQEVKEKYQILDTMQKPLTIEKIKQVMLA